MEINKKLKPCPFCNGTNTIVQPGTQIWTGMRYGPPIYYELHHWCTDGISWMRLKDKTVEGLIEKWEKRYNVEMYEQI